MKKATKEYIEKEELDFLGAKIEDIFVPNKINICGYESTDVELLSATRYKDWINGAFYSCFATWDMEPTQPVRKMMKTLSFAEKEKKVLHMLKSRPISAALESAVFTFRISGVPRTFLAQITRHRQMSFGVQSMRVNSTFNNRVRAPQVLIDAEDKEQLTLFEHTVRLCKTLYKDMIEAGIPMEQARLIMPMGTTTTMSAVMRLKDIKDYIRARTSAIAQDEHTQVVGELLKVFKEKQPEYYNILKTPFTEKIIQEYAK